MHTPQPLSLGIIGMTEGNGHPYSWSAIFNNYDRAAMTAECPFPVIPAYLNRVSPETIGIPGAKVTCVYCDRRQDAEHVARLSRIPTVVDRPEDMIGQVDAVLIATDIGAEHVQRARPFLDADIPVFIDKPLCDNREDLAFFSARVAAGARLLSSSALRYAKELAPYCNGNFHEIGEPRSIVLSAAKKWETYGIHALETVYPLLGPGFESIRNTGSERRNIVHIKHRRGVDVVIVNIYDQPYSAGIQIGGTEGCLTIRLADTYSTFRAQLVAFVDYLRSGVRPFPFSQTEELMRLVIGGIESRQQQGKEIMV